jgi:serine/threonine-protein kinase
VLEKVGAGGMGAVYRVEHVAMGKIAAMKVLHGELAGDREAVKRFRREAEAVSRLGHPNTVQVFDFGLAEGTPYIVMEFVRGEDLGAILRRDRTLPLSRTAPMLAQVCGSLTEAHELGIVHRDLKPENLIVSRTRDGDDLVKVLDFGLARIREREELASVTARGSLLGTPYYMSPEQIRADSEPDARSDVYSLGAVMYRMLCGEPPFTGQTPVAVLTRHLTEDPVPPRLRRPDLGISGLAEAIVLRALQKRPEDRFQSVDTLRRELERARTSAGSSNAEVQAPAAGPPGLAPPGRRDSDVAWALASGPTVGESSDWQMARLPTSPMEAPTPRRTSSSVVARLSRSDFDRYERGLRRQRWVRLLILPLAVAALVGAAVLSYSRTHTQRALGTESEPNNDAAHANLLASGAPIRGRIAERISHDEGDRDVYRIPAGGDGPRLLHVAVTGVPNIDLVLEVFDARGDPIAKADTGGDGDGEVLANLRIGPGESYVVVRQVQIPGTVPAENVTDEYSLLASWRSLSPSDEAEPNDDPSQVTALEPGREIIGYLDHPGDVDRFRVGGAAGMRHSGELRPPAGVAVRVHLDEQVHEVAAGQAIWPFEVRGGQSLRLERADPPPSQPGEKRPLPGADEPYHLVVR